MQICHSWSVHWTARRKNYGISLNIVVRIIINPFGDKSNNKEIVCSYFVLLFHRIVIIYVIKRLKRRKGIFAKI